MCIESWRDYHHIWGGGKKYDVSLYSGIQWTLNNSEPGHNFKRGSKRWKGHGGGRWRGICMYSATGDIILFFFNFHTISGIFIQWLSYDTAFCEQRNYRTLPVWWRAGSPHKLLLQPKRDSFTSDSARKVWFIYLYVGAVLSRSSRVYVKFSQTRICFSCTVLQCLNSESGLWCVLFEWLVYPLRQIRLAVHLLIPMQSVIPLLKIKFPQFIWP